ncbi:MAG: MaoC family dehydratase N-terminal domain-containing protein [Pelagimonas sp.]|jgi:3-methylfumaryl-CoA hydratase|nr:MaoC family dehydratase N-terminal domain-containing protein [Pelagimonas sp.]
MQDAQINETRQTDVMDVARARALEVALGRDPVLGDQSPLPPFFHQIYFWDAQPPTRLGRDGHPKVGQGLIPDMGLPRRMWAGGELTFHAPLLAGIPAEKRSVVETATHKQGRTGPLAFVTLKHEIWQNGQHCVTERQDLVYRQDPDPTAPRPVAPQAPVDETQIQKEGFDATLLFRYSALTFNGHRIHYDLDYARDVEGYSGLVVHGPLLAQRLMLMAEQTAPVQRFRFRAVSPLMHFETASFCRKGDHMWVRGPDGRQCMWAEVTG